MFGLLTTIPIMLTILAFLAYASLIIHGGHLKKVNRTVRRFQLFVAGAIIAGTFPYTVGILNGVYFDLFPQDPYMPLVLDRFTSIGAFLGICLMALIIIVTFIRYSFFFNISKDFAKKFCIALSILIFLADMPLFLEASLFAAKGIDDQKYLTIARAIALAGSFFSYSFVFLYMYTFIKALKVISTPKGLISDQAEKEFRNLLFLIYTSLACMVLYFIFFSLTLAAQYRSREYLLTSNLGGAFIGLSVIPILDIFQVSYFKVMQILEKKPKALLMKMAPAFPMEMITRPPTIDLDAAKTTEIMK